MAKGILRTYENNTTVEWAQIFISQRNAPALVHDELQEFLCLVWTVHTRSCFFNTLQSISLNSFMKVDRALKKNGKSDWNTKLLNTPMDMTMMIMMQRKLQYMVMIPQLQ